MAQMFVCKNCGITFRGKASKKPQHCSRECYKATAAKRQERICHHCGKRFRVNTSAKEGKFCGRECSFEAQRALVTCICEQCGVQFQKRPGDRKKYCTHKCFFDACRGQERPIMRGRKPWNSKERPSPQILHELYETHAMTTAQLGERYGVQSQTICVWLHDANIPVRQDQLTSGLGKTPPSKRPIPDKETLTYLYGDFRLTTRQMADHYQVSSTVVGKWLRHHGIPRRAAGTGLIARGIEPPSDPELQDMIHVKCLTYREVADQYGVDQSAVQYWLDQRGIERPKGQGWQGGSPYQTPDGQIVRSSYEKAVAQWLIDHRIDFIYEPNLPFIGRADFLANGWYIEVWGVTGSTTYKARKSVKQSLYKAHGLPLIELPAHSFGKKEGEPWKHHLARCLLPPC